MQAQASSPYNLHEWIHVGDLAVTHSPPEQQKQSLLRHLLGGLGLSSFVSILGLLGLLVVRSLFLVAHLLPLLTELLGNITNLLLLELELLHDLLTVLAREDHIRRQRSLDLVILRDNFLSLRGSSHIRAFGNELGLELRNTKLATFGNRAQRSQTPNKEHWNEFMELKTFTCMMA